MKKRAIAALLTLLLALALCACGGETTTSTDTTGQDTNTASEEIKDQAKLAESSDTVDTGNFQITIKDAQLGKDYEGQDVFIVGLNWTNNYTEAQMASVVLTVKAYQDGVEMDQAYVLDNKEIPIDDSSKNIQPGASQDVYYAFVLTGSTSDITVEASEWLGGDGKAVKEFTFADVQ